MQINTDPSWDDVRVLLAVARQGSLSGAARELSLEHSTVARRLSTLERTLGLRLFDRLQRGWRLTTAAQPLVQHAERVEAEMLGLQRAVAGSRDLAGRITVSVPPHLCAHFLIPALAAQREALAGIELNLLGELREANLERREADLALRFIRPEAPGLVARQIGRVGFGLYATRAWCSQPAEDWQFIGFDPALRDIAHARWIEQFAAGRPFTLRTNSLEAHCAAVRAGLGFGVVPHYTGAHDPGLQWLAAVEGVPQRDAWLVMHRDLRRAPAVRRVADLFARLFEQQAGRLMPTTPDQ